MEQQNIADQVVIVERATQEDHKETDVIKRILRDDYQQYEDEAQSRNREAVLAKLNSIIKDWIREVGRSKGKDENTILNSGGKIFTFGSYRLGVHAPNTDIDALCVAPRHVDREEDFFGSLFDMLKGHQSVKNLYPVQKGFVPRIGMEFEGIEIDLIFARIQASEVGEDLKDLLDDNILKGCDDETVRSLNGTRVADILLKQVPNVENFRTTLRCVKLWAKNRGIYSNVLGYFGGIAYMILVAKICKIFPYLEPNKLLRNFFSYCLNREWSYNNPVILVKVSDEPMYGIKDELLYKEKNTNLMPILTPAYPCMNSTHNVSHSTKEAMLAEFEKGLKITEAILKRDERGQKQYPSLSWKRLFKKFAFFSSFTHYIMITICSIDDELHSRWLGFVESKLRFFVSALEKLTSQKTYAVEFRPWPKSYTIQSTLTQVDDDYAYTKSDSYFIGMRIKRNETVEMVTVDLTQTIQKYYESLAQWIHDQQPDCEEAAGLKHVDVQIRYVGQEGLPEDVKPKMIGKRKERDQEVDEKQELDYE
ncbi:hypothetical protein FGO68_gene2709 [Halteria grandinella]|uniref:Poly(A) polymerase n=1 Tax=Halteria grandinella TaxID=5974 RepID=A0A8J8P0J2_HALGN|nr:hypothetical protein FGO68_gene2709 [Halteria grandinella]